MTSKRVCVCVLGDIGHSPRMQCHAISLAESGFNVDIVGYLESTPYEKLTSNPKIKIQNIPVYKNNAYLPRLLNYFFKVLFQALFLLSALIRVEKPSHILVQNPPSVPSLLVVWLICRLRHCYFVIDWHNYGYSILALSLGSLHPIVKLYKCLEFFIGAKADFHFCVSNAMSKDLQKQIGKTSIVLYDRPQYSLFKPDYSLEEKHDLFLRLQKIYSALNPHLDNDNFTLNHTLFTKERLELETTPMDRKVQLKLGRPALIVSGTSWTEDEDFQLLFDALWNFDQNHAARIISAPADVKLICIITGKGPLKKYYEDKIKSYCFKHTKFVFPWLKAEDYPLLLASADLGICLHKSSSGLDLPMKVVDMFGNKLPACAFNYPCIGELVLEDQNGCLFDNAAQLEDLLVDLLENFPESKKLHRFRMDLAANFQNYTWNDNWQQTALPIFQN